MFSGSSLTFDKLGIAASNKCLGDFNQGFRQRSFFYFFLRLATYLHPTTTYGQAASEVGEAAIHLGARAQTSWNRDLLAHALSKDAAKDIIFDRSVGSLGLP